MIVFDAPYLGVSCCCNASSWSRQLPECTSVHLPPESNILVFATKEALQALTNLNTQQHAAAIRLVDAWDSH